MAVEVNGGTIKEECKMLWSDNNAEDSYNKNVKYRKP